jgi:hypothetical protein
MPARTSDAEECPVCGASYDQRVVVERGDRWRDIFPGSPLDVMSRYPRRCAALYDEEDERQLRDRERAVYFHGR